MSESRGIAAIGSPRASLEENFALLTLAGPGRFFAGVTGKELGLVRKMIDIMKQCPADIPSLADVQTCDMVFVLGEDPTDTAPMMALNVLRALRNIPIAVAEKLGIPFWNERAIREEIQQRNGPLFIAAAVPTGLDEAAADVYLDAPDEVARLGFAVANLLDPRSPAVQGLSDRASSCARIIADTLRMAQRPLVISGAGSGSARILEAAGNVARALCRTAARPKLSFVFPECNSLGLGLMCDQGLDRALEEIENGRADTLIILGNDLFRREDSGRIRECLAQCRKIVLLDQIFHATAEYAHLVLPVAAFAEQGGTLVNNEGRGQRFFQVFVPAGDIRPARTWICSYLNGEGFPAADSLRSLDDAIRSLSEAFPDFKNITDIAPPAGFRIHGMKIPRESHRVSGRTSVHADRTMHEPPPPDDPDSPLGFSMEGYEGMPPSSLIHRYWAPGWNSVQSLNKFQAEVGGGLHGGASGLRLIESRQRSGDDGYFRGIPGPFSPPSPPQFIAVPIHHIFGSEELSRLCPAVASRIPAARVLLNPLDAVRLGIGEGDDAEVLIPGSSLRLPVEIAAQLQEGLAGLPAGFPGLSDFLFHGRVEVRRATA
jgi:NADH-quinone oxidoreductase subunit G